MPRLRKWHITSALLSLMLSATALSAQEQSLGEVARAERQRRAQAQEERERATRVITNHDLERERILEPRAEEGSAASQLSAPLLPPPGILLHAEVPATPAGPEVSLGEYARELRRRRAARRSVLPVVNSADLQREVILPPQLLRPDEMLPPVSGHVRLPAAPSTPPPEERRQLSLGEVARQARAEREQRLRKRRAPMQPAPAAAVARPVARPAAASLAASSCEALSDVLCVQPGDSLWKLAQIHLGDGARWPELWRANPDIQNPDLIYPGQALRKPGANTPATAPAVVAAFSGHIPAAAGQTSVCHAPAETSLPRHPLWTVLLPRSAVTLTSAASAHGAYSAASL